MKRSRDGVEDFVKRRPLGAAGAVLIVGMVLAALFAEVITTHDPTTNSFADLLKPPSFEFPFGTDQFGRDVFTRIVYGSRTALLVVSFSGMGSPTLVPVLALAASASTATAGTSMPRSMRSRSGPDTRPR